MQEKEETPEVEEVDVSATAAPAGKGGGQNDEARTQRLLRQAKMSANSAARETLVAQYRPLVEKLARRFIPSGIPIDDLVQEGFLGLLHAINHYDPTKNVKFITYATHCIGGHLRHFLRDRGQIIKEPAWLQELSQRVRRASDALIQQLGRQPTTEEIAASVGLSEEAVAEIESTRALFSVASLEESTEDGTRSLAERESATASGARGGNISGALQSFEAPVEEKVVLEDALKRLKELEQRVIYLFYYEDRSQTEIARELSISNNYVSHILKNSARKLQQMFRSEAVREAALQFERHRLRLAAAQYGGVAADEPPTSIVDPVTGLYSRDYFEARLDEELSRAVRHQLEVSIVRVRVGSDLPEASFFAKVAQTIKSSVRRADIVARTDTFEIAALLPHTGETCSAVTQRLNNRLAELQSEFQRPFSFAVGAASYPDHVKKTALYDAALPEFEPLTA
jgi:RNA polymerase sigma-B factor